jgi:hypothetical protein
LYLAEVRRIAGGESYYEAAADELRTRGYPTRSVFNWRTPLPMWLLGTVRSQAIGRAIIGLLAAALVVIGMHVVAREGGLRRGVLCGVLLIGALLPCWLDEVYVMPVVWAGVLIGLSICTYAIERPRWGFAFGLAALFVRELAAPYCIVCLAISLRHRRWRELAAWSVGLALYFAFYAWHASQVLALIGPDDRAHAESWLRYGGAAFLIAIAQMNMYLALLPQWVTAVYLPLALLGFASWNSPAGQRAGITGCVFLILFAFVGQPFNQYWGSLIAPLLCFGAAQSPAALVELLRNGSAKQILDSKGKHSEPYEVPA